MTREEKCKLAIERGYTYDPETGLVYNKNKEIGFKTNSGYKKLGLRVGEKVYILSLHQFAWYFTHKECVEEIDHINNIKTDNRICNLRAVTKQQNQWNRPTAKGYYKSTYKESVYYHAYIYLNSKRIIIGSFNSEQEARSAYLAAKEIYHKI